MDWLEAIRNKDDALKAWYMIKENRVSKGIRLSDEDERLFLAIDKMVKGK